MSDFSLKEIPVQVLSLKKGDVLVLRFQAGTPFEYQEDTRHRMIRSLIAANKEVVVTTLEDDVDLAILKK